jgi:N-acetylglucosamine-6-phosphate deacetylase
MQLIITNNSISDGTASSGLGFIVNNGKIEQAGQAEAMKRGFIGGESDILDLRRFTVLPGLIDLHIHGGNGFDTMDGTRESINALSLYKLKEGVTSFCPATVTASDDMTAKAVQGVSDAIQSGTDGAKVLGIFLEGPYLNPANKGAHPQEYLRPVDLTEMKAWVGQMKNGKVSLAIAPELDGAMEAIRVLSEMGVDMRIGHSSATLEQARAANQAGAGIVIHTYNAMSPLNHREPGMVGAAMTLDKLYAEIICDLVHVHPAAVKALAKTHGADKTILVTDCMSAGGLPDGEYKLGELPVFVQGGVCRLNQGDTNGPLAGSTARLIDCVKNMHQTVGMSLEEAVAMATCTPARAYGVYDTVGSLAAGKQADIIAIDEDFNVRFVMVDGVVKVNDL